MTIKGKLLVLFMAFVLIPLTFVSALTFRHYQDSMKAARLSDLRHIAAFKTETIETYFARSRAEIEITQGFYNIKKNLPILTRLADAPEDPAFMDARKMLDGQLRQMQSVLGLLDIMLADPEGKIVYASNPEHFPEYFLAPIPDPLTKAFEEGKKGVYFSDVFSNKMNADRPGMLITAPLADFNGAFIGVIAFEIDMAPLYDLIRDTPGMGRTGETLIGRRSGDEVIYLNPLRHDPKAALQRRVTIGKKTGGPIQEAVQGKNGAGELIDYRGQPVIAAWHYLPSLQWGVVAKIDSKEAFAEIVSLRILVTLSLVIISVLAGIAAFSLARSISGPIQKLSRGVAIIGNGNLDYKVGDVANDEIGQLSRAFEKMAQDLKKTSAAAIVERERLYAVLETLPVYVVLLDRDYRVPFANKFFRERFGESDGKRCYEYLFNRTEACENCESYKAMKSNAPHRWEWAGPDGRNYDIYDFPFTDTDGSPMVMEMGIDITERKKVEAELKKYRDHLEELVKERTVQMENKTAELQIIMDSAPVMIFYKDKENHFIHVNKTFAEAMGTTKEKLEGRSIFDLYPKEQAEAFGRDDQEVIRSCKAKQNIIEPMETPRGERIVQTEKIPFLDERGVVAGVIGFSVDITERKQSEDALLASEKSLARSQEIAHFGSWRLDAVRNILTWSDENHSIFGIPKGTPLTYEAFLGIVHPDDRKYVDTQWKAGLSGEPYDIEHRIVVGGQVKWVREKAYLEFDEAKKLIAGVGITQDITDRKKAEEALIELANAKSMFAATVSHELRSPLATIKAITELVSDGLVGPVNDEQKDLLATAKESIARLGRLTNNVLAFKKMKSGKTELELLENDIHEVVREAYKNAVLFAGNRKADLSMDLENDLPKIKFDRDKILQVLINLISNAVIYSERGAIVIQARLENTAIHLSVVDFGPGIEAGHLEKIFEPFAQVENSKKGGTGLGLAIVKEIVLAHRGRVWAESPPKDGSVPGSVAEEVGKGSAFHFTLPL